MKWRAYSLVSIAVVSILAFPASLWGETAQGTSEVQGVGHDIPASSPVSMPSITTGRTYTLDQCIQRAMERFPQVLQAIQQKSFQEAQADQAWWAWLTPIEVIGSVGGPTPEAHGNARFLRSEASLRGSTDLGTPGLFAGLSVRGAIPLFTFGKLAGVRDAANAGVKIADSNIARVKNELRANVTRAYLAYGLSKALDGLVVDGTKTLSEVLKTSEEALRNDSEQVSQSDVFMLRTLLGALKARRAEAAQGLRVSREVMRFLLQIEDEEPFDIDTVDFDTPLQGQNSLATFQRMAERRRPELRMAEQAIKARQAAVDIQKAFYWPDLLLVGSLTQNYTSNRDFQRNPFVNNTAMEFSGVVGLAVRLTLDYPNKIGEVHKAEAELQKSELDVSLAKSGIGLQVRKAHAELESAVDQALEYQKAEKAGKQWVVTSTLNFESGLGQAQDLFQAVRTWSEVGAMKSKARFDYGMARAAMAEAVNASVQEVNAVWTAGTSNDKETKK